MKIKQASSTIKPKVTKAYSEFMKTLVSDYNSGPFKEKNKIITETYKELYGKNDDKIKEFINYIIKNTKIVLKQLATSMITDAVIFDISTENTKALLLCSNMMPVLPPTDSEKITAGAAAVAIFNIKKEPMTVTIDGETYFIVLMRRDIFTKLKSKPVINDLILHEMQHYIDGIKVIDVNSVKTIWDYKDKYLEEEQRINKLVAPIMYKTYAEQIKKNNEEFNMACLYGGIVSSVGMYNKDEIRKFMKLVKNMKDKDLQKKVMTRLLGV